MRLCCDRSVRIGTCLPPVRRVSRGVHASVRARTGTHSSSLIHGLAREFVRFHMCSHGSMSISSGIRGSARYRPGLLRSDWVWWVGLLLGLKPSNAHPSSRVPFRTPRGVTLTRIDSPGFVQYGHTLTYLHDPDRTGKIPCRPSPIDTDPYRRVRRRAELF